MIMYIFWGWKITVQDAALVVHGTLEMLKIFDDPQILEVQIPRVQMYLFNLMIDFLYTGNVNPCLIYICNPKTNTCKSVMSNMFGGFNVRLAFPFSSIHIQAMDGP